MIMTMTHPSEEWLPIRGYEGSYEVSNLGRVRSLDRNSYGKRGLCKKSRGVMLSPAEKNKQGHSFVCLFNAGERKMMGVHRLVLVAFSGHDGVGLECRHLDGNPRNNNIDNLKWGTRLEVPRGY